MLGTGDTRRNKTKSLTLLQSYPQRHAEKPKEHSMTMLLRYIQALKRAQGRSAQALQGGGQRRSAQVLQVVGGRGGLRRHPRGTGERVPETLLGEKG